MKIDQLPFVAALAEAGPDDRGFDVLLLAGPVLLLLIALLGRSVVTEALAATYLLVFVGYVLYRGLQ